MFVLYSKIYPIPKQEVLDILKENNVKPERIVNGSAGSAGEWASYWLYDDGAYKSDLEMVPMLGDTVHTVKMVYREFNTYEKIDKLLNELGFRIVRKQTE